MILHILNPKGVWNLWIHLRRTFDVTHFASKRWCRYISKTLISHWVQKMVQIHFVNPCDVAYFVNSCYDVACLNQKGIASTFMTRTCDFIEDASGKEHKSNWCWHPCYLLSFDDLWLHWCLMKHLIPATSSLQLISCFLPFAVFHCFLLVLRKIFNS